MDNRFYEGTDEQVLLTCACEPIPSVSMVTLAHIASLSVCTICISVTEECISFFVTLIDICVCVSFQE